MKKIIEKPFNHKVWCDMTFDNQVTNCQAWQHWHDTYHCL